MRFRSRCAAAGVAATMTMAMVSSCASEAVDDPEPAPSEPTADASESPGADDAADGSESPSEAPVDDEETPADDGTAPAAPDGWQTLEYGPSTFSVPESWDVTFEEVDGEELPRTSYGEGFCEDAPDKMLAFVINTWVEGNPDPVDAVTTEAERLAERVFADRVAELQLGEVQQSGSWASVPATLQLAPSDDPCDGSEALVVVVGFAYEDGSGTGLFMVVGELGLPESPTPEDLVEIANSFG